jgi:integrase
MPNSRLSRTGGVIIRDQWKRAGRGKTGKRWLYRVWNPHRQDYLTRSFEHDPAAGRRLQGCAEGDAWASWVKNQVMAGIADPVIDEEAVLTAGVPSAALTTDPNGPANASAADESWTTAPSSPTARSRMPRGSSLAWVGAQFLESITDNDHSQGHLDAVAWTLSVCQEAGLDDLRDPGLATAIHKHLSTLVSRRPGQISTVPVSARTKNHHIAILYSIGTFALENGYSMGDPFISLKKFKEERTRRKVYTIDDLRYLLADENNVGPWYRFVALAAYTGFRSSTLTHLTWDMVKWDSKRLHVPASIVKTKRDVLAPIQPELETLLTAWHGQGGPLLDHDISRRNSDSVNDALPRFIKYQCGVNASTLSAQGAHAFRHSVASLLAATGMTTFSIMDAIGHDSMESSKHYAQGAEEYRQIVQEEGWPVGQFHLRTLPPALQPFTFTQLKAHVDDIRPEPAWLLATLCIYLGIPATSAVKLKHKHLPNLRGSFCDPFVNHAPTFTIPDDLWQLLGTRVGGGKAGTIFPDTWHELTQAELDRKLESYWEDRSLPIGKRKAKALWATIPEVRKAFGLPSTLASPKGLTWLVRTKTEDYKQLVLDEGGEEDELCLMTRERRKTIHPANVG